MMEGIIKAIRRWWRHRKHPYYVFIHTTIIPSSELIEIVIHEMYCLDIAPMKAGIILWYLADKKADDSTHFEKGLYGEPTDMAKRTAKRLFSKLYKKPKP